MNKFARIATLKSGAALLALTAAPAWAQVADTTQTANPGTPAAAVESAQSDTAADSSGATGTADIVVTGSRISRPDLQSSSPIATVTANELTLTNSVTAESFLSSSPQFVPGTTATSNNGNGGTATVDLRGLGARRTLVLIDGHRMVPSDIDGAVDINAIPTVLIKQVEVLTGGASAVYGADAVSGVVNFVLNDDFKGLKGDASASITNFGDAPEQNAALAAGMNIGDRGHFVVAGQYTHRDGVYDAARHFAYQNLDAQLKPVGSSNTTPTAIDINAGRFQLDPTGAFGPFYQYYNFNPANLLEVPLKRYNVTALLSYKFSDAAEFFARGSYTRSDVTDTLAPTATAGFNFIISPNNPYLTPGNKALIFGDPGNLNADGTANVAIRRRITESGGRIENYRNNVYFGIAGLRGDVSTFHYEVFGQYGLTRRHADHLNDLDYNKITQAINAVPGAGGAPVCADPSGGCVPINLFTLAPISPAALTFVSANGAQDNRYTQFVTGASIAGDLNFLKSPLADKSAAIAVGVEYRSETGNQIVDANYGSGNLIYYGQGTTVPNASFNVKEAYGELKVPLIVDRPFFRSVNIEGGVRYSKYRNNTVAGRRDASATTYKFGGDWTPVEGLRFRAIFNRAIRDPNLYELNSPITQAGTDVLQTDPCANGKPKGNAALAAICIAQGAPAGLVNTGVIQDVTANQTNINAGGNPNLKPEVADTLTIGAVFSPRPLRGLNITVDYYKIKIDGYINSDGSQDISNQCFANNISSYCALFVRNAITGQLTGSANPNGQFPGVSEVLVNIATLKTQGVDVTADYRYKFGARQSVALAFGGTYVGQYYFAPGGAAAAFNCAGRFGNTCAAAVGNPVPRWKHIATLIYDTGDIAFQAKWRYIGPVSADAGTAILVQHIKPYSYIDATASFRVNDRFGFRVGASNLFNINPPIVGGSAGSSGTNGGNTFPNVYDVLGRVYFAGASFKF